jgi:hypothetical protein
MKNIIKSTLLLLAVGSALGTFTSCKDSEDVTAPRLFRPILSDNNIVVGLDADTVPYIKVKWNKYTDANQYVVKAIAADGTDSMTITTDSTGCIFNNLGYDKEYNIKIHSVNTVSGLQSKDYVATTMTSDFPTVLNTFTSSNIIDTQVRVTWTTDGADFDSLKVYKQSNDSLSKTVAVTSSELTAGQKIIRGLNSKTSYRIEAYQGTAYKGKKIFSTVASENYQGAVVDLRGLTEDDSYKFFSTSTTSTYANAIDSIIQLYYPNQDVTFVLQGGTTYRLPTLVLPATTGKIKFVTGLSLNGEANFAVSGSVNANANTTIGGVQFSKIFFTDAPLEGKAKNQANYGGTYLFNFNAAGSDVKSINISNCTIKYKRGICRIQSAATVDTFTIDNCIVDSIGGYGITNADNAGASIPNIIATNCTFSSCEKTFVGTKQSVIPINKIDIENCTFVYCIADTKPIFDYKACTVAAFTLKNCLFGISGKTPTDTPVSGVAGWSGTVSPMASDCFFTSDYLWVLGTDGITPTAQIAGTKLSTNTAETFTSPTTSNFKVISADIVQKKVGDPRWY